MRRSVCVLVMLLIALPIFSRRVESDEMSQELVPVLLQDLNTFAKTHHLNDSQMRDLIGEIVLNDRQMKKGGVGIVDSDMFLIVDGVRNAILFGKDKWEGRVASEPEVVLADQHRVLCSVSEGDLEQLRVVIFSPSEVRYINEAAKSGGRYLRSISQSP